MNFIEKYDILELSDKKKYTVSEINIKDNITYLMLLETVEEEVTENLIYGKIVVTKTKKYGVETIKDKKEIEELNKLFKPLFEESTK